MAFEVKLQSPGASYYKGLRCRAQAVSIFAQALRALCGATATFAGQFGGNMA